MPLSIKLLNQAANRLRFIIAISYAVMVVPHVAGEGVKSRQQEKVGPQPWAWTWTATFR